jgi:hypothetical protein
MNYKISIKELHIPISKNKEIEVRELDVDVSDVSLSELANLMKLIPRFVTDMKHAISNDSDERPNDDEDNHKKKEEMEKEPSGDIAPNVTSSQTKESEDVNAEGEDRELRVIKSISNLFGIDPTHIIPSDEEEEVYEIGWQENTMTNNPKVVVLDKFDLEYNRYLTTNLGFYFYAVNSETYDWAMQLIGEEIGVQGYPRFNEDRLLDAISQVEAGDRVFVVPTFGRHYVAIVEEKHREFYTDSKPNELLLSIRYHLHSENNKEGLAEERQVKVKVRELDFLVKLEKEIPPK